jgi:hypothetical protein
MDISDVGHILIYGPTYSGKTYFCKYLIEQLKPENIYVFTSTPRAWKGYELYDDFDGNITKILTDSQYLFDNQEDERCNQIVVFDDYNDKINTITNKKYKELFTGGRHKGIRVINLAQQSKAIGPTVRDNVKYVFTMALTSADEVKSIADTYFNKERFEFKKIINKAHETNTYSTVMLNVQTRKTKTIVAPEKKKSNIPSLDKQTDILTVRPRLNNDTNQYQITKDVNLPQDSVLNINPSDAIDNRVVSYDQIQYDTRQGENSQFGNKYANGNMIDNSHNNFNIDYQFKNQQLKETNIVNNQNRVYTNKVSNQMELDNHKHKQDLKRFEYIDKTIELLNTPDFQLTGDDKDFIAKVFNYTLKPTKKNFDRYNYNGVGVKIFLKKYDDRIVNNIEKKSQYLTTIEKVADIAFSDNPILQISKGISFMNAFFK